MYAQVRKMPIDLDGQTIWVECVESQKSNGAAGAGGGGGGGADAIMMDLGDADGKLKRIW